MNKMKRILCAVLVIATVIGSLSLFSSCKKTQKLPDKRIVDNVYKMNTIPLPEGIRDLSNLIYSGGKLLFLGYEYESEESWQLVAQHICEMDPATGEYTGFPVAFEDNEWLMGFGRASDGYVVISSSSTYSEEDGFREYWNAYNYSLNGELRNKFDLAAVLGIDNSNYDDYVYLNNISVSENGDIIAVTNSYIARVSADGSQVKKYDLGEKVKNGDSYISGFYDYGENKYMLVLVTWEYTETESSEKVEYFILDLASDSISEPQEFSQSVIDTGYYSIFTAGDISESRYDLYFQGSNGINGYDLETDTFTELLNWTNSDMTRGEMGTLIAANENLFFGTDYDIDTYEMSLVSLSRLPDEEQIPKYIITLAYEGNSYRISNAAVKFNRQSDEYRIELKQYTDSSNAGIIYPKGLAVSSSVAYPVPSPGSSASSSTSLHNDILTGNIPDILLVNDNVNMDSYINKGIFADIYEYMNSDETFDKSEYLTNVFEAFEVNGKLYELVPNFQIVTLAAKKSLLDGIDGWNMEEFMQFLSKFPEGTYASLDLNRAYFLEMMLACNYNTFVDRATGKCRFDSDEFKKVLEYAKTLSENSVWDDVYGDEYDQELAESLQNAYKDGKALLYPIHLYEVSAYMDAAGYYTFGGTDIGFVGYPSDDRNGHAISSNGVVFAMSAQSHDVVKQGVWEFFKYLLSESYQDPEYNYGGFPVKLSSLEKMIKQSQEIDFGWQWYGDNGYWIDGGIDMPVVVPESSEEAPEEDVDEPVDTETDDDVIVEEPVLPDEPIVSSGREYYMTDEQVQTVMDLLKKVNHVLVDNRELLDIITQESAAYFEGKKGLDETVDIIQRRANIFINTNR